MTFPEGMVAASSALSLVWVGPVGDGGRGPLSAVRETGIASIRLLANGILQVSMGQANPVVKHLAFFPG